MRILVTGGAGYVGGFAARHLLAAGHEVIALDNLCAGHREALPDETLVIGDIGDRKALDEIFLERRIEAVMHFAALAAVSESVSKPRLYYRNNVANTLNLLETMLDHEVKRIVFSSTCAVYGETDAMPLREDSPTGPTNPYAFSKLAIERMIQDFACAYDMSYALLRYFNAAGASADGTHGEDHEPETHLIPLAIQAVEGRREKLRLFGKDYPTPDGTCIRDYVHVEDLARAHELAILHESSSVFNIGTGRGHSVMEVLKSVERITGKSVPFQVTERRPGDTARLVASCEKIRAELGWQPQYEELDEIVATAWRWHRNHPGGYERGGATRAGSGPEPPDLT
jgi:UDP-glucose-4-epimerase GalE